MKRSGIELRDVTSGSAAGKMRVMAALRIMIFVAISG
jgi:hypothetical protein